ncbi:expressed protein [Phakopsora pachyrhizi]|uniref:Expressed protein n=1 Tax=Phakopsora pachyrhizi TaxID=170000 RepID=A0AAV0APF6_PHAPC|nr:expressed protein [Phakopsora pachyrhizi]
MSHVKLFIRPPPHQGFVSGFPSIPASTSDRPSAHLSGTVEVRPSQSSEIYAVYLHLELQRLQVIQQPKSPNAKNKASPLITSSQLTSPSSAPSSGRLLRVVETVNCKPTILWKAPSVPAQEATNKSLEGKPFDGASDGARKDNHTEGSQNVAFSLEALNSSTSPTRSIGNKKTTLKKRSSHIKHKKSFSLPPTGHHLPSMTSSTNISADAKTSFSLGWARLASNDFEFKIPLPESLPPSMTIDAKTGLGIHYVLVATLCARPARVSSYSPVSWFKRSSSPPLIVTTSAPIYIVRHQLHSSWPIYRQPSISFPIFYQVSNRGLTMKLSRQNVALGPGDEIVFNIQLESETMLAIKLTRFEILLTETIIYHSQPKQLTNSHYSVEKGAQSDPIFSDPLKEIAAAADHTKKNDLDYTKTSAVVDIRAKVNQTLFHKNCLSFDVRGFLPPSHTRMTIHTASHITISYSFRVKGLFEPGSKKISKEDRKKFPDQLEIDQIPLIVGDRESTRARAAVEQIGHVPHLCPQERSTPTKKASLPFVRPKLSSQVATRIPCAQNSLSRTRSVPGQPSPGLRTFPSLTGIGAHHKSYSSTPIQTLRHHLPSSNPSQIKLPPDSIFLRPPPAPVRSVSTTPYGSIRPNNSIDGGRYRPQAYEDSKNIRKTWACNSIAPHVGIQSEEVQKLFAAASTSHTQKPHVFNSINDLDLLSRSSSQNAISTRSCLNQASNNPPPFPSIIAPLPASLYPITHGDKSSEEPLQEQRQQSSLASAEVEKERLFTEAKAEANYIQEGLRSHALLSPEPEFDLSYGGVEFGAESFEPILNISSPSENLTEIKANDRDHSQESHSLSSSSSHSSSSPTTSPSSSSSPSLAQIKSDAGENKVLPPNVEQAKNRGATKILNILPQYPNSFSADHSPDAIRNFAWNIGPEEHLDTFDSPEQLRIAEKELHEAELRMMKLTKKSEEDFGVRGISGLDSDSIQNLTITSQLNSPAHNANLEECSASVESNINSSPRAVCQRDPSPPPPKVNLKTRPQTMTPLAPSSSTSSSADNLSHLHNSVIIDPQRLAYLNAVAQREYYLMSYQRQLENYYGDEGRRVFEENLSVTKTSPGHQHLDSVRKALDEKEQLRVYWEHQSDQMN